MNVLKIHRFKSKKKVKIPKYQNKCFETREIESTKTKTSPTK